MSIARGDARIATTAAPLRRRVKRSRKAVSCRESRAGAEPMMAGAGGATRSGHVLLQLRGQHGADLPRVLQPPDCDLPDGLEVEAVLQAGVPVAVLLTLLAALGELGDTFAGTRELDGLADHPDRAEVFQVHGVGEQLGLVEHRGAV